LVGAAASEPPRLPGIHARRSADGRLRPESGDGMGQFSRSRGNARPPPDAAARRELLRRRRAEQSAGSARGRRGTAVRSSERARSPRGQGRAGYPGGFGRRDRRGVGVGGGSALQPVRSVLRMSVAVRIVLRYLAAFLVAKGVLLPADGALFATDPE